MTDVRYVPGSWVAVAGEHTWLLLAVAPESDLVERCWELVRADARLDEVLAAIIHEGLRAVNGFALIRLAADEKRVVVRGEACLQVVDVSGDAEEISAAGVGTWVDRNLGDVAGFRVAAGPGGSALPLRGGVVLANELAVELASDVVMVEHTSVVQHEEPVELTIVREEPPPRMVQATGVIQSFDWAPQVTAPAPAQHHEPVTETVLRTTTLSPNDTRMLQGSRTGGPRLVRAKQCPAGHLSADYSTHCRVCGVALPEQNAAMLPAPVLGQLRLSNGDTISLDRNVVMGRDPSGDRGNVNLVQVGRDSDTEISRTHVEVRLENWDVLVRDLGSTNGTTVARPGCPPEKLAAHIDDILYPGTRIMLGDQFYFTFEVTG